MDLVDLIVAIVVVTILVTVVVGLATYVAYKFRLAREPGRAREEEGDTHFFFVHEPPDEGAPAGHDESETGEDVDPVPRPSIADPDIASSPSGSGREAGSPPGDAPVSSSPDRTGESPSGDRPLRAEGSA